MKRLVRYYVDDTIADGIVFGKVRKKVFKIIPKVNYAHRYRLKINYLKKWISDG